MKPKKRIARPAAALAAAAAAVVSVGAAGCAPEAQVQMQLIDQARRGIAMTGEALKSDRGQIEQYEALRRTRLDESFDADVRDRAARGDALTADWIIEARKGYATGVDALAAARERGRLNADAEQRTLQAVDDALLRLRWLQALQLRLLESVDPASATATEPAAGPVLGSDRTATLSVPSQPEGPR